MKLQRTTLILLISALLLGGFVYLLESQRLPNGEATQSTSRSIFAFAEDQIQSLTIQRDAETLEFERVNEPVPGWQMKTPEDTRASDAAVAYLLNLLVEGKSERTLTIPANQLQEHGLDDPSATVKIQLKNQETHQLVLGKPDFNRRFLYAQADPPAQSPQQLDVLLVPIDFENAVNRPTSEWQQPQAENSERSSPSPAQDN